MSAAVPNQLSSTTGESISNENRKICIGFKTFLKKLTNRKTMEVIQTEIQTKNELRRDLNFFQLVAIGLGVIIGVGIFVLSGLAASRNAGPSIIISFAISAFAAFLSALSVAEMSSLMTSCGTTYTYTYAALGEFAAWFVGWNTFLWYQMAGLSVVVNFSNYLIHMINLITNDNTTHFLLQAPLIWSEEDNRFSYTGHIMNLPAVVLAIFITFTLAIGIRTTGFVNLVLTVIKMIIILIYIFACIKYINPKNYTPFFPPNKGTLQASTNVFFAYLGFEAVPTVSQEAKEASRSIPRALITSLLISTVIYLAICTVMVGIVPYHQLDVKNPWSKSLEATEYGVWLSILMDLGVMSGVTTVGIISILGQIRIFYAMAHDRLLPEIFSRIDSRTKTPLVSTLIAGIFSATLAGFFPVDIFGETSTITALITFIILHVDLIVMRYAQPDIIRSFRVPFGPWVIPLIGISTCGLLLKGISTGTVFRFLAWVILGQIFYFCYGFRRTKKWQSSESLEASEPTSI